MAEGLKGEGSVSEMEQGEGEQLLHTKRGVTFFASYLHGYRRSNQQVIKRKYEFNESSPAVADLEFLRVVDLVGSVHVISSDSCKLYMGQLSGFRSLFPSSLTGERLLTQRCGSIGFGRRPGECGLAGRTHVTP